MNTGVIFHGKDSGDENDKDSFNGRGNDVRDV
jgi:hypothetical protein